MEPLLIWMISLAVPTAIGAGSYLACRRLREPTESLLNFVILGNFILVPALLLLASIFFLTVDLRLGLPGTSLSIPVDTTNFGFFLALATAVAWAVGGSIHEKTAHELTVGWSSSHFLMYCAMLLSLSSAPIGIGVLHFLTRNGLNDAELEFFWIPYFLSLALTPAMTPMLFWVLRNSELAPGREKHFDE
jgi:hypothetical protein